MRMWRTIVLGRGEVKAHEVGEQECVFCGVPCAIADCHGI